MYLYFLFLGFYLAGPVYSSSVFERFIKTVNGPTEIECNKESFIVTNDTNYMKCNGEVSCLINETDSNTHFACLKKIFQRARCKVLEQKKKYVEYFDGCFVRNNERKYTIKRQTSDFLHIFVLQSSKNSDDNFQGFSYFPCKTCCKFTLDKYSWILMKVSGNEEEEDFGEFFVEINRRPTTDKEKGAADIEHTTTEYPTTEYPTTEYPTTEYPITVAPTESHLQTYKILVAVVVILLVVIVLICLLFYRERLLNSKMTPNAKLTNANNEFPLSGNLTINPGSRENTNTTENHEFNRNVESEVQPQQQFAQMPEAVYAGINHGEGLKNDVVTGGPRHVVGDSYSATGGPRHVVVNGELYATVNKEEESIHVNYFRPDYLIREEVNGEMYTLVEKRRDK